MLIQDLILDKEREAVLGYQINHHQILIDKEILRKQHRFMELHKKLKALQM
jgi:hypothetical protein